MLLSKRDESSRSPPSHFALLRWPLLSLSFSSLLYRSSSLRGVKRIWKFTLSLNRPRPSSPSNYLRTRGNPRNKSGASFYWTPAALPSRSMVGGGEEARGLTRGERKARYSETEVARPGRWRKKLGAKTLSAIRRCSRAMCTNVGKKQCNRVTT